MRIDHDRGGRLRVVFLHRLCKRAFGHVGQVLVQGQHQILARAGRGIHRALHKQVPAQPVTHSGDFHSAATQGVVVCQLHPLQAVAIQACVADHGRGQLAVGVHAARLPTHAHPWQAQGQRRCSLLGRHPPLDPGEVLHLLGGDRLVEFTRVQVHRLGQPGNRVGR